MSKIYDALIKLEKKKRPNPGTAFAPRLRFNDAGPLNFRWKKISLEWKMIGICAGLMLLLGFVLIAVVNQLTGRALRAQIDQRALAMATNLSDAAAGHVIGGNILELHALLAKYARLDGSAYAFIADNKGRIVAHTLAVFPPELAETLTTSERRRFHRRTVRVQGKVVYETRAPVLEGQLGAAHIGVWEESVATEIHGALLPVVGAVTSVLFAGVLICIFLARGTLHWLADRAVTIRAGDLQPSMVIQKNFQQMKSLTATGELDDTR